MDWGLRLPPPPPPGGGAMVTLQYGRLPSCHNVPRATFAAVSRLLSGRYVHTAQRALSRRVCLVRALLPNAFTKLESAPIVVRTFDRTDPV